jgi:hypothetical protein
VDKLPKAVAMLGTNQRAAVFWRLQFLMKLIPRMRERVQAAWYRRNFLCPESLSSFPENPESFKYHLL